MDDCPVGFEACELGVMCDWLARVMKRGQRKPTSRLAAMPNDGIVILDGIKHAVGDEAAAFVQVILNAKERVSLRTIKSEAKKHFGIELSHPERTRDGLPKDIIDSIDVNNKGHRIKDKYLG